MDSKKDYVVPEVSIDGIRQSCRHDSALMQSIASISASTILGNQSRAESSAKLPPKPLIVSYGFRWPTSDHHLGTPVLSGVVSKASQCLWTVRAERVSVADLVLFNGAEHMEEHRLAWCEHELKFPRNLSSSNLALVEWSAPSAIPLLNIAQFRNLFSEKITYRSDATIPISLMCPLLLIANSNLTFQDPIPDREFQDNALILVASPFRHAFSANVSMLSDARDGSVLQIDPHSKQSLRDPYSVSDVIDVISKYKFTIVAEIDTSAEFVSERLSVAFLAGTLPIYYGNAPWEILRNYVPDVSQSIIRAADFESPLFLLQQIQMLDSVEEEYRKFFEWKKKPLPQQFQKKLSECIYTAQDAVCELAMRKYDQRNRSSLISALQSGATISGNGSDVVPTSNSAAPSPFQNSTLEGDGEAESVQEKVLSTNITAANSTDLIADKDGDDETVPRSAEEKDEEKALGEDEEKREGEEEVEAKSAEEKEEREALGEEKEEESNEIETPDRSASPFNEGIESEDALSPEYGEQLTTASSALFENDTSETAKGKVTPTLLAANQSNTKSSPSSSAGDNEDILGAMEGDEEEQITTTTEEENEQRLENNTNMSNATTSKEEAEGNQELFEEEEDEERAVRQATVPAAAEDKEARKRALSNIHLRRVGQKSGHEKAQKEEK